MREKFDHICRKRLHEMRRSKQLNRTRAHSVLDSSKTGVLTIQSMCNDTCNDSSIVALLVR